MTTTTFRVFLREPFDLALGQPHQLLISSASVAIVAAEAATIVPYPYNILLAIGAEWAYLRGLISGEGIRTRWALALNVSAVLLVILYGSLWGFRGFHLIPDAPPPWAAVLLTIVHIGAIGAVTICSAMLHRAGMDAQAEIRRAVQGREQARQQRIQDERDALAIEMERKQHELALWQQAEETKARLKMQSADARMKMRRDARPARTNAEPQNCPNCGVFIPSRSAWLAARRWQHCPACKDAPS